MVCAVIVYWIWQKTVTPKSLAFLWQIKLYYIFCIQTSSYILIFFTSYILCSLTRLSTSLSLSVVFLSFSIWFFALAFFFIIADSKKIGCVSLKFVCVTLFKSVSQILKEKFKNLLPVQKKSSPVTLHGDIHLGTSVPFSRLMSEWINLSLLFFFLIRIFF